MKYQYPLMVTFSEAGNTLTPKFAFDGSIGAAYYITPNVKTGLFWYGQWQQFQFTAARGSILNSGSENLFYSAMDFRLGYDF